MAALPGERSGTVGILPVHLADLACDGRGFRPNDG